jgi:hypothetical protein
MHLREYEEAGALRALRALAAWEPWEPGDDSNDHHRSLDARGVQISYPELRTQQHNSNLNSRIVLSNELIKTFLSLVLCLCKLFSLDTTLRFMRRSIHPRQILSFLTNVNVYRDASRR